MKNISRTLRWLLLLAPLWFASVLMADETDLYYAQTMSANPNILFVLDNSGSMQSNKIGTQTRMQVLQSVFSSVMTAVPSDLNIGLMRYGGHGENAASGVSFPVKPVESMALPIIDPYKTIDNFPSPWGTPSATTPVRTFLSTIANKWSAQGYTPIVDALYEASRYYRGEDVAWGRLTPEHVRAAHPATYSGTLTWNPNVGCSTPTACVQDWDECWQTIVPNSCQPETRDVCNWGVINNNGCCWVSTGVDESGNATGGYCSSYTCENYGCLDTPHPGTVQVCQQYACDGAVEGTAEYISPIQYECQSNYLVLMSDGKPEYQGTWDTPDGTKIYPPSENNVKSMITGTCADSPSGYKSGTCGPELTKFLRDNDQSTATTGNNLPGTQSIQTFTIGFGLEDIAGAAAAGATAAVAAAAGTGTNAAAKAKGVTTAVTKIMAGATTTVAKAAAKTAAKNEGVTSAVANKIAAAAVAGAVVGKAAAAAMASAIQADAITPAAMAAATTTAAATAITPAITPAATVAVKNAAAAAAVTAAVAPTKYLQSLASVADGAVAVNDADGLKLAFENVIKRVQDDASPKLQLSAMPAFQGIPSKVAAQKQPLAVEGLNTDERKMLASLLNPFGYWRTLAAGGFFPANDLSSLLDAFNSIINKVTASASSFSSPSYQVDQNTLLAHDEYIYIPVFDRNNLPRWPGNIKKFKRSSAGKIVDANGADAVDEKGVFKDSAQDFWSSTLDGKDVTKGGTANKLPLPDNRKLYTDMSEPTPSTPVDLIAIANKLDKTNAAITAELLGNASMTYRDALLDFGRGKKADGTPRYYMGDMLNGKPQIVTYGTGTTAKSYILAGSNEGYLHAIYLGGGTNPGADTSSSSGVEQWAFMPKTLLKNMDTFYQNSTPKKHVSGIDGVLNVWRFQYDSNSDGVINSADSYKTYVYFGLRQGGSEYYMLDITDITTPKVVWHITSATTGFGELGLAWSKLALAKMRIAHDSPENTTTHASDLIDVLVFGGGYDINKNNENTTTPAYTRPADGKGRNVYIVNAKTGALIWSLRDNVSGASAKLLDGIPGDIRVMDMDRNGALDRLYFSDTGGHIWRVDMDIDTKDGTVSPDMTLYDYTKASLSEFANLAGSGLNKRMFFYEPEVAMMQSGGKAVLTLTIGSGYRTRPLNQGADRFYMLVDRNPFDAPDNGIFPITEDAKLVNIVSSGVDNTAKLGTTGTSNDRLILTDTSLNGWYYDLPNTGEKVLAPAVTFLNKVVFTTFSADAGESTDPCESPPNSARAYVLDLFNGQAVADLDRVSGNERSVIAGVNEILDAAQIIFRAPSLTDGTACTSANKDSCDKQYVEIRVGKMSLPLMDNSNGSGAGVAGSVNIGNILPRVFWRDDDVSGN